ncbi:MAG: hypothetical protein KAV00_12235 [Phycisphaerae bacterium]|nr:hypothetical protein [Phycisphaerae bacterium]
MASSIFELLFDPPQTKPLPDSARAHIALSAYSRGEGDRVLLWGECRTVTEVEDAVKYLKKDLDRVLAKARRKFPPMQGGAGH